MGFYKFDIEGGTLKNIGTKASTLFDLTSTKLKYDSVNKAVIVDGVNGLHMCTQPKSIYDGTNFLTSFAIRMVVTFASDKPWLYLMGSYTGEYYPPIFLKINTANKIIYIDHDNNDDGGYLPHGDVLICDGVTKNDLTFDCFADSTKSNKLVMKITNNVNGSSVSLISSSSWDQCRGTKSFFVFGGYAWGGVTQTGSGMTFYSLALGDTADDVNSIKWLFYKDGKYYNIDGDNKLVDIGSDLTVAIPLAIDTIPEVCYSYAGEYQLVSLSATTRDLLATFKDDVNSKVFVKESDGSYTGLNTNDDIYSGEGVNFKDFNIDDNKDVVIRVPESIDLEIDRSIEFGEYDISKKFKNRTNIAIVDKLIPSKKSKVMVGDSYEGVISIKEPSTTDISNDSDANILCISANRPKGILQYNKDPLTITSINPDNNIIEALATEIDTTDCIISSHIEDDTMFNDTFELDGGAGISEIAINVLTQLSIKLPVDYTAIKTKPDWLKVIDGKLIGIPQKKGAFDLVIDMGTNIIESKIVVSGLTRIK